MDWYVRQLNVAVEQADFTRPNFILVPNRNPTTQSETSAVLPYLALYFPTKTSHG